MLYTWLYYCVTIQFFGTDSVATKCMGWWQTVVMLFIRIPNFLFTIILHRSIKIKYIHYIDQLRHLQQSLKWRKIKNTHKSFILHHLLWSKICVLRFPNYKFAGIETFVIYLKIVKSLWFYKDKHKTNFYELKIERLSIIINLRYGYLKTKIL